MVTPHVLFPILFPRPQAFRTQQLLGFVRWGQGRHQEGPGAGRHSPELGARTHVHTWPSPIWGCPGLWLAV